MTERVCERSLIMKIVSIALSCALLAASPVMADTLPTPEGDVLVTLSGALSNETANGVVEMDIAQLQAMPQQEFTTSTIWMEGTQTFTGVSLKALLEYAGASGATIEAVALNDYKVEIPVDSLTDEAPIVAYLMDGERMSPRDKGPLWIVYPYDADADYRSEVIYSRSIWQLDRIVAVK